MVVKTHFSSNFIILTGTILLIIEVGSDCGWCSDEILNKSDKITWKNILFHSHFQMKIQNTEPEKSRKATTFFRFLEFCF